MVRAATALGNAETARKESIAAKQAEVPNGAESGTFDSPVGSVGGETNAQWLDKYNAGVYDSPADDAKAFKILGGMGMSPQF